MLLLVKVLLFCCCFLFHVFLVSFYCYWSYANCVSHINRIKHFLGFKVTWFSWNLLCTIIILSSLSFFRKHKECCHRHNYKSCTSKLTKKVSFTKLLNRSEPKLEPLGTPVVTSNQLLKDPFLECPWRLLHK